MERRSRSKAEALEGALKDYTERVVRFVPSESLTFQTEAAFVEWTQTKPGRKQPWIVLLDSRGSQFSSEEFAAVIRRQRDDGTQHVVFAIGPADGWTDATRARANLVWSLGKMTLPHQLARVVVAEQVYRAMTILAGHPYHSGH